jgi:NADPH2:quinone reductase
MMRAIQVQVPGGPECLVAVDLPLPTPAAGQVRVRAQAIGVGRPDVLIRQGTYKWMPPLPAIPGAELAGEIDAIGTGVQQWQIGDRVLVSSRELAQRGGCYVESIVVPEDAPYRLPASISCADAVSLPNLQLALALMQVGGKSHSAQPSVLITGASGGVATMLSRLAKHLGFITIGTSRKTLAADDDLMTGFDHVITGGAEDLSAQIEALTGQCGVDLVFDHLGGRTLIDALHCLAPLGTVVSYNIVQGAPSEDVFQVLRKLLAKSLAVRCFSMHTLDADRSNRRALMQSAIDLMAAGYVKPPAAQIFQLDAVRQIHTWLDEGAVAGKLVMQP